MAMYQNAMWARLTFLVLIVWVEGGVALGSVPSEEVLECGPSCLYVAARMMGHQVGWDEINNIVGPSEAGLHSLRNLSGAAEALGMNPVTCQLDTRALRRFEMPTIVHLALPLSKNRRSPRHHYVLAVACDTEGVFLLDPPHKATQTPWDRFNDLWTGNALVFAKDEKHESHIRSVLNKGATGRLNSILVVLVALFGFVFLLLGGELSIIVAALFALMERVASRVVGGIRAHSLSLVNVFILISVLPIVLLGWGFLNGNGPNLTFPDGDEVYLGSFEPGTHTTKLKFANRGNELLMLDRVKSNCSCAVTDAPRQVFPNDMSELEVEFAVGPGRGTAGLLFLSNDPKGPKKLTLSWAGLDVPRLHPPRIADEGVRIGKLYERQVNVYFSGSELGPQPDLLAVRSNHTRIHITHVRSDPTAIHVPASKTLRRALLGCMVLRVSVDSPDVPEILETQCVLELGFGDKEYRLNLPVHIAFDDEIRLAPDCVQFSGSNLQKMVGQERHVYCSVDGGTPVEVMKTPAWLDCKVTAQAESKCVIKCVVTRPPTTDEATEITIRTANSPALERTVPVHVLAVDY